MKNCKFCFLWLFHFFFALMREREEESERKRESSHKWIKALTFTVTICVHNIYLVMFVISKSGPEFKCHLTWPIVGIYRGIMLRRPQLSIGAELSISQRWQGVYKIQYWLTDWQDYFFWTAVIAQFMKQDHVFQINWDIKIDKSFFVSIWFHTTAHHYNFLRQMIFLNFV